MTQQTDDSESDPAQAKKNAQANFDRMLTGIPMEIQDREASLASRLAALPGSPIKKGYPDFSVGRQLKHLLV
jgi:hypothetical protein